MNKLVKLELRRNNLRTYVIACAAISVCMLGFLYLFAYAPQLEPTDESMKIFSTYQSMIPLFGALNVAVFAVLAAVMYTKFVIEEYSDKRASLLFSYPVSRKKILLAKLGTVGMFVVLAMIVTNIAIYTVFGVSEHWLRLINEPFTAATALYALRTTFIMAIVAASVGIMAVGIGFFRKSVPTTIVSAVLLASLFCNIVAGASGRFDTIAIFMGISLGTVLVAVGIMMKKVTSMEVE